MDDLNRFMTVVGWKAAAVARATGISAATISRWANGVVANPNSDELLKLLSWAEDVAKKQRLPASQRLNVGVRLARRSA
jgi:transcriptional regulator with XRE-family HTH domain